MDQSVFDVKTAKYFNTKLEYPVYDVESVESIKKETESYLDNISFLNSVDRVNAMNLVLKSYLLLKSNTINGERFPV